MCDQPEVIRCQDEQALLAFLEKVDTTLPVPLSARVNLAKYARRNLERGYVYAIEQDGEIACAALFYYNFEDRSAAYLDLLATAPGYNGRGYASRVMDAAELAAKNAGMTEFHLHTNDTNKAALSLYSKRGYEIIKTEPKIQMRKFL